MKLSELSRAKRQEYLSDRFVRHFRPGNAEQRKKREFRVHATFSHLSRMAANKRWLERFGLDVTGPALEVSGAHRSLRNARKQERQAA